MYGTVNSIFVEIQLDSTNIKMTHVCAHIFLMLYLLSLLPVNYCPSNHVVLQFLHGLNLYKAAGPDQIFSRFLKEMATSIISALPFIHQASLNQVQTPDNWKWTFVKALFKKGNRSTASNYGSYICYIILKCIIRSHLIIFIGKHERPDGFRKKRYCKTNLITTLQDWSEFKKHFTNEVNGWHSTKVTRTRNVSNAPIRGHIMWERNAYVLIFTKSTLVL